MKNCTVVHNFTHSYIRHKDGPCKRLSVSEMDSFNFPHQCLGMKRVEESLPILACSGVDRSI